MPVRKVKHTTIRWHILGLAEGIGRQLKLRVKKYRTCSVIIRRILGVPLQSFAVVSSRRGGGREHGGGDHPTIKCLDAVEEPLKVI